MRIEPLTTSENSEVPDGDEPETPEQIDDWLRWYRSLEPLEFTPEEKANLAAGRQKTKEYDIAKSEQWIKESFR